MKHRIIRDFERPNPSVLAKLKELQAGLMPSGPLNLGAEIVVDPAIHALIFGARIFGPAVTVDVPQPDHLMAMYAIEIAQPGDVLVIAARGETRISVWGGSMTKSSRNRKLGGIVIDGVICDSGGLASPQSPYHGVVPIFARGASPAYTTWELPGSINVPVPFGGLIVEPGDLIMGNDDGLVAIPKARLDEALEKAEYFKSQIPFWHGNMDKGMTWFEVLELQQTIDRLGIPELGRDGAALSTAEPR